LALRQSRDAGVDRTLAVAYIALADGETNNYWGLPRETEFVKPEDDCCRTVIGLEAVYYDEAMRSDAQLLEFANAHGWVGFDQNTGKMKPAGAVANPFNQQQLGTLFEYSTAIAKKTGSMAPLYWVALGPTQINLYWSDKGKGCIPATPDEAWAFYLTSDAGVMLNERLYYLTPPGSQGLSCESMAGTGLPAGDPGTSIPWLQKHTGSRTWAERVYWGHESLGTRRPYKDSWAITQYDAAAIYG